MENNIRTTEEIQSNFDRPCEFIENYFGSAKCKKILICFIDWGTVDDKVCPNGIKYLKKDVCQICGKPSSIIKYSQFGNVHRCFDHPFGY